MNNQNSVVEAIQSILSRENGVRTPDSTTILSIYKLFSSYVGFTAQNHQLPNCEHVKDNYIALTISIFPGLKEFLSVYYGFSTESEEFKAKVKNFTHLFMMNFVNTVHFFRTEVLNFGELNDFYKLTNYIHNIFSFSYSQAFINTDLISEPKEYLYANSGKRQSESDPIDRDCTAQTSNTNTDEENLNDEGAFVQYFMILDYLSSELSGAQKLEVPLGSELLNSVREEIVRTHLDLVGFKKAVMCSLGISYIIYSAKECRLKEALGGALDWTDAPSIDDESQWSREYIETIYNLFTVIPCSRSEHEPTGLDRT